MVYTKQYIEEIALKTGFIKANVEKVLRLADILRFLNQNSFCTDKFVLKGGTAINFCIVGLPRLSVDIDLDFAVNMDKDEMLSFRKTFKEIFVDYIQDNGYLLIERPREHYALDSFLLSYNSVSGNKDNIKVEINYMDRAHIYPCVKMKPNELVGADFDVLLLDISEVYASKTVALLSRRTPRDLYDVYQMIDKKIITDAEAFRKCFVFYSMVGGDGNADNPDLDLLDKYNYNEIKRFLKPVISKSDKFDYESAVKIVKEYLSETLRLTENEKEFVRLFRSGEYKPEMLFSDEEVITRIKSHPMVQWKMQHRQ